MLKRISLSIIFIIAVYLIGLEITLRSVGNYKTYMKKNDGKYIITYNEKNLDLEKYKYQIKNDKILEFTF